MKSILLVDDETLIFAELERMLKRYEFRVERAGTLEEALRMVASTRFDGILLEFNLRSECAANPRAGAGPELLHQLRARGMKIPILIVTAMEGALYERASFEAGADDFIVKTDGTSHLLKRLNAHLHGSEEGTASAPAR